MSKPLPFLEAVEYAKKRALKERRVFYIMRSGATTFVVEEALSTDALVVIEPMGKGCHITDRRHRFIPRHKWPEHLRDAA